MAAESAHFLEGKKIIIAGSGIAGLSFVVALRKQWNPAFKPPDIVIYDRDNREVTQKREGYSLSLNGTDKDSGLVAIRHLGLLDEILKHAVTGPDSVKSFRMWDKDWNSLMELSFKPYDGLPTAGIRIARRDLRNILTKVGESDNNITWGTSCTSAEVLENGRIRVHLSRSDNPSKNETEECDMLIAADGANSKIRAVFRPDDTLIYRGAMQMGGVAKFPHGLPKPIDESWGIAVSGQGVACFMSPVDKTSAVWGLSRNEEQPRPVFNSGSPDEAGTLMAEARQIGHMLQGPFPAMLAATEPSSAFVLPTRDKMPFTHETMPKGVVLIGDSNHAVSPFAGNGANLALKDGWDLAAQLCESKTLEAAVAAYDKLAFPRAVKTVESSHRRIAVAHSSGLKFGLLRVAFGVGSWLMWLTGR